MKRLLMMAALFAATLALCACGGAGQPDQGGTPAPSEPTQAQSGDSTSGSETTEESAEESGEPEEASSGGPTATTIDGEEVSLGGEDVTAFFFMAGW